MRLQGIVWWIDYVHVLIITTIFHYFIEISSEYYFDYASRMLGYEELENEFEQLANDFFPRNTKNTNKVINGLHLNKDEKYFEKYRWKRSSSR